MKALKHSQGILLTFGGTLILFGFVASIFLVPNYRLFRMKAQESEARNFLTAIYDAQKAAYGETGSYIAGLSELRVDISSAKYYHFGFASDSEEFAKLCPDCQATKNTFKVVAVGRFDAGANAWTIDQDRKLVRILMQEY